MQREDEIESSAREVGRCAGLAVLLEVSGSPKPGNVHRYADFSDTRFEHFLASGVVLVNIMGDAALSGIHIALNDIEPKEAGIGRVIRDAVKEVREWQRGGNTSLGTIILLSPISVAAGMTYAIGSFSIPQMRDRLETLLEENKPEDTLHLYEAIAIAKPGGLGRVSKLDATETSSRREIMEKGITLYDVFKISAERDSISKEWTTGFNISFETGLPEFEYIYEKTRDVNYATIHTFLRILSRYPDTLIARKRGIEEAEEITGRAREVLREGGCLTEEGQEELRRLDKELRDPQNELNPGTTADLTAASVMLALLKGFRP